eukprot:GILK01003537.1.p1 GENE.GILK01003537.1~~GILK01003537.1.p1  ORF type:complete len:398 (-),score=80.56 GILK01003537.1:729-1886(-)
MSSLLFICGDFMEDYEAFVPYYSLLALGYKVDTVCPDKRAGDALKTAIHDFEGDQTYTEKVGHNFPLNATFDDIQVDNYAGVYIPGGRAPEYLALDRRVLAMVKAFVDKGKVISSICHGPQLLAAAKVIQGRTITAYSACEPDVTGAGGIWSPADDPTKAICEGKFVTGVAWPAHPALLKHTLGQLGATIGNTEKKILMLCGDFMEDLEVMVPYQALLALGYQVDTVCPNKQAGDKCATAVHDFEGQQTYTEKKGHYFVLNKSFDDLDLRIYDGVLVPGGRSAEYLRLDKRVLNIVKHFHSAQKPIASICHGQLILAAAAVLDGIKCTAYPACQPACENAGANWIYPESLDLSLIDRHVVTAAAWGGLHNFIQQFLSLLDAHIQI